MKTKNKTLRDWLEDQPRSELTYSDRIVNPAGIGWTTHDLLMEGNHRDVPLQSSTINKWRTGTQPRGLRSVMERAFPGIIF